MKYFYLFGDSYECLFMLSSEQFLTLMITLQTEGWIRPSIVLKSDLNYYKKVNLLFLVIEVILCLISLFILVLFSFLIFLK